MEFENKKRKLLSSKFKHKNPVFHNQEEKKKTDVIVNTFFKKSYTISNNENYILPEPESMFDETPWEISDLQKFKKELNETKSKLNNYNYAEWHEHTSQRNKAKDVEWRLRRDFDPEFVTQAWCKFHEIISKYPLIPKETVFANNSNKFFSLHLCEAPGAFITCLNHWLKTNTPTIMWDWMAMTYNPYYEGHTISNMISDDRFIRYTLKKWFFGKDFTGDLMNLDNLDSLIEKCKEKGKVNLITADGSINCKNDPGEQEKIVVNLHFCEVVAAVQILETGGNLLLKIFTIFEHETVSLIYMLTCIFKKIHFYKPVTSREGNSEIYVICLDFKGPKFILPYISVLREKYGQNLNKAMFKKNDIPQDFINQIISCAEFFKNCQCEVIENNILTYNSKEFNKSYFEEKIIAKIVADKFMSAFPLRKLHIDLQIVGNSQLKKNKKNNWITQVPKESFNEIKKKQVLEPVYHLLMYKDQFQFVEPVTKQFIFKPMNFEPDVCITVGKPYKRVQNSRFCTVQISEIYNLLFQAVDEEKNLALSLPPKENIEKQKFYHTNQSQEPIHFCYTDPCNNFNTITNILQTLLNFKKGNDLVLFGYLLLTQFNVGLIYLLSHTFEKVEFTISDKIGCSITFKNFVSKESILKSLEVVCKVAENATSSNLTVLSVIMVTELYDSELYSIVERLNNWIAKYGIHHIASIYEKQD